MATTIDIAPTVGHSVLATQLGTGSSPGYDAIDLRRGFINLQEGVFSGTDWKVTQSVTPAMSVDIAASTGRAAVQGDTIANQGLYTVAPHSATVTLTIGSNASGNPRLDQIVLHVYDATHDGSGNNKASLEVLQGTATSGATLDNRSGAASLPNTCMRLADVLVASGAATITNSVIRDRRTWARGARWRGIATSGDVAATTGWTEFRTDALKARLECSGSLVLATFVAQGSTGGAAVDFEVTPWLDGADPDGTNGFGADGQTFGSVVSGAGFLSVGFSAVLAPSAGSHLFSVAMQRSAGTGTVTLFADSDSPATFSIVELLGGNSNNGTT